jgi:cell division protease FtsH
MILAVSLLVGFLLMQFLSPSSNTNSVPPPQATEQVRPGETPPPAANSQGVRNITHGQFDTMLANGEFTSVAVASDGLKSIAVGVTATGQRYQAQLLSGTSETFYRNLLDLNAARTARGHQPIGYQNAEYPSNPAANIPWFWIIMIVIMVFLFRKMSQAASGQGQGGHNQFMKSTAKDAEVPDISLDDVGGIDHIKGDLRNWVPMMVNKGELGFLGGDVPKGLLLVGPPGTGKTLTARALAGEMNKVIGEMIRSGDLPAETPRVKFFTTSGSEFVQMFVGVGAARVRDLFATARKHAPSVIFIDEMDALGKREGGSKFSGGNDERIQTLNQILVEMDGFNANEKILVVAATNRPDMMDEALRRPGRFDRTITIPKPDFTGRCQILPVLANKLAKRASQRRAVMLGGARTRTPEGGRFTGSRVSPDAIFEPGLEPTDVARELVDMTGAEMEEVLNRAAQFAEKDALVRLRAGEFASPAEMLENTRITMAHVRKAFHDVLMGPEMPKSMPLHDKVLVAYHEAAGHGVVAWHLHKVYGNDHADPIQSATIMPRGQSLGAVWRVPGKDSPLGRSRIYYENLIAVATAGRLAEVLYLGPGSETPGAASDIQTATNVAQQMVTRWGMSPTLGFRSYAKESLDGAMVMDAEVQAEIKRLVDENYLRATAIILKYEKEIELVVRALLAKTTLGGEEFDLLMRGDPDGELAAKGFFTLDAETEAEFQRIHARFLQVRDDTRQQLRTQHPALAAELGL